MAQSEAQRRASAKYVREHVTRKMVAFYPTPWRCAAHHPPSTVETGGALRENKYSGRI